MTISLKGRPVEFSVAGGGNHIFEIPADREQMHPKVAKAFAALETANDARTKVMREKRSDRAAVAEASDAIREAVGNLYDVAGASAKGTREQAAERFETATRRYARLIGQAQEALQDAATAGQVFDMAAGGHGIGIDPGSKAPAVVAAHFVSQQLEALPPLPAIDAALGGRL